MKNTKLCKIYKILLVLFFATGLSLFSFIQISWSNSTELTCFSPLWPHEKSALVPDPAVLYGKLENGLRYVIMENGLPKERVAMYLYVGAGSINENDNERGYAHFLEHMLFNGSTHFPPGKLVEYFQKIGMNFGADTNAYTTYDRTVYSIVLPHNTIDVLRKGLLVVHDYARGALLLESEVDRERGVILAEKTSRDSAAYRTEVATRKNALKGTLLGERQPIGLPETIEKATGESLRQFYDKWYRPENMVVVIVGDIEKKKVEDEIVKKLSDLQGKGNQPVCPDIGRLEKRGVHSFYYPDREDGDVNVALETYWHKDWENDSFNLQVKSLKEYIASTIIEKRLEKIEEKGKGEVTNPRVYAGDLQDRIAYAGISASTTEDKWKASIAIIEKAMRRAIQSGVTEAELDRVKNEVKSFYISRAQKAEGRESTDIAREIIWNISNNRVFQSPSQEKNNLLPALDLITRQEINETLVNLFNRSEKNIEVTGNLDINAENPEKLILNTLAASENEPVEQYVETAVKKFPYFDAAQVPAQPVSHEYHEEIDADTYRYENNVILNLKKTEFKKNQLEVMVEFGPGKQGETLPGISLLAESVIDDSGTSKLTATEIEDSLAGSSINFNFGIDKTRFYYSGDSLKEDADLLLQTLYTFFRDPGLREQAFRNTMIRYEKTYESLRSDIRGAEKLHFQRFFAGGNALFGMESWETLSNISLAEIEKWVMPIFQQSAVQISIVGDFDKEKILEMVGGYFGALPKGRLFQPSREEIHFPSGEKYTINIPSNLDKSLVVFAWNTQGFTDISTVRRLSMLASVFEERIRLYVREKLGTAYSPSVYNMTRRSMPDYGAMFARIIVDKANIETTTQAVKEISKDLFENGVTEEELNLSKKPLLTYLKDMKQSNKYWLRTVFSGSEFFPEQLQWPNNIIEDNAAITANELTILAHKFLDPSKVALAIAKPEQE